MSIKIMSMVFDASRLTPTQKLVLLALADHANDEGYHIYPSIAHLAGKTALSTRSIQLTIRELKKPDFDLLTIIHPGGGRLATEYKLNVDKLRTFITPESDSPHPRITFTPGMNDVHPTPESDSPLIIIEASLNQNGINGNGKHISNKKQILQQAIVGVLAEVTGMDYKIKGVAGRLGKRGKELLQAGYIPEQVKELYGGDKSWWYQNDWRGRKGQKPKPEDIQDTIGEAVKSIIPSQPKERQAMKYHNMINDTWEYYYDGDEKPYKVEPYIEE